MPVQTNLDRYAGRFSLSSLRNRLRAIKGTTLDDVTLNVDFDTPKTDFTHRWTLEDVKSIEQLNEEIDETLSVAAHRLRKGLLSKDGEVQDIEDATKRLPDAEILPELSVDAVNKEGRDQLEQFQAIKESQDEVKEAIKRTEQVYERVDTSRRRSIGQRLTKETKSLEEYESNIEKVDQNIDFEENVNFGTEGSSFQQGRQRTQGDLTWFNRDGEPRRYIIFGNSVTIRDPSTDTLIERGIDKQEAKERYLNNRLG